MSKQYTTMSNIPAHGNAFEAKVANARENFGQGRQMMGAGGAGVQHLSVHPGAGGAGVQHPSVHPGAGGAGVQHPFVHPGAGGAGVQEMTCHFPQPAPKRVYCHPAAFSSLDGRSYHRILDAYGHSRPAQGYY